MSHTSDYCVFIWQLALCQDFHKSFLLILSIPLLSFIFRRFCLTHTLHHRFQNWFWIWNPSNRNRNQLRKTVLLVTSIHKNTVVGWSRAKKKGWDYFFIDLDFENWQKLILLSGLHRATQSNMKEEVNMLWCKKLFQIIKHML